MTPAVNRPLRYCCLIFSYENVRVNRSRTVAASRTNLRAGRQEVTNPLTGSIHAITTLKIQEISDKSNELTM